LLFCSCYVRMLRVRHSFPTRRSSDLCYHNRKHLIIRWINVYHTKYLLFSIRRVIMSNKLNFQEKIQLFTKKQKKKTGRQDNSPRSEEHTSELQSRFEIVCRLLLEKTH